MRVSVEGGKYTYVITETNSRVLRYGELWRDAIGDKFTYSMAAEIESLREQVEKLTAALKLAREALGEVQDLIGESHGVYGLHLNGDESPWGELEQGGRFERLTSLNVALAAIDALGEVK